MRYIIEVDVNPFNPREFPQDCFTTIVARHKRYNLGDINVANYEEFEQEEQNASYAKKYDGLFRRIWFYDHSVLRVELDSANPYWQHASWDAGMVGFMYIDFDKAKKLMGWKKINKDRALKLKQYLENEFKEWKNYIEGNTYMVYDTEENSYEFEGTYEECEEWVREENDKNK